MRGTKIICTLGPVSSDKKTIGALIDRGMNVARLNFSHGTVDQHRETLRAVREVAAERARPIAVMQDLQGPKIRIGILPDDGTVTLSTGDDVVLVYAKGVTDDDFSKKRRIPHSYAALPQDAHPGDRILLDDGRLELAVTKVDKKGVTCGVIHGGDLAQGKGMNLPQMKLSTPALTEKDRADLAFGKSAGVDFVALSFVRTAQDVAEAKALAGDIPLIAKIEKPEVLGEIDQVLDLAEGLMVARGDLGVEMAAQQVPLVQKNLVEQANRCGKLVIIATEMLDSMRHNPRPTRAEVSDVANAIFDGADAVMLSGETAAGQYPIESIQMMSQIVAETERSKRFQQRTHYRSFLHRETTNAIAHAAVIAAQEIDAATIICFTESGKTGRLLSDYRPGANIVAGTPREEVYRRLALEWGVSPILLDACPISVEGVITQLTQMAITKGHARSGEKVVLVLGSRKDGPNDLIKVHVL